MIDIFNQHRAQLFGIAYRMLGSVAEADDMLQETWLRWQKQNTVEIQSPKAWLISTITRLCIDQLRSARRVREEYYGVWLPEPLVESAAPSPADAAVRADSLTMAFMLLLETLSPVERAVFLLREVFDYDYADVAAIVRKSEANCRQIARRAKAQLAAPVATPKPNEQARRVVEQFIEATASGEMTDLLALLTEDATLYADGGGRVPAAGEPIHTAVSISRFFIGIRDKRPPDTRVEFLVINGQPGVLMRSGGKIYNAVSFQLREGRIQAIYIVRNPEKLAHLEGRQANLVD